MYFKRKFELTSKLSAPCGISLSLYNLAFILVSRSKCTKLEYSQLDSQDKVFAQVLCST